MPATTETLQTDAPVSEIIAKPESQAESMLTSAEGRSGYLHVSVATGLLAIVAFIASLYLARAFFVPLLIGILASYALSPLVAWLSSVRIPRSVGAAIVLALLLGGTSWVFITLSDDAAAVIEKLPEAARKLRKALSVARADMPTAMQNMREAAKEIEVASAEAASQKKSPVARSVTARDAEPTAWLRDFMLVQSALAISVIAQAPIVILLTYFLLASGGHFRRKLVQFVGPSLSRKKDTVRILGEINEQVQRYLFAMLLSNSLLALVTWLVFAALGVDHAGIWGIAAGLLHFVPYLGSALVVFASGVAAFLQFGSIVHALAIAGVSLVIAGVIGLVFATWLQSRFARINAAVLFIALLFFGWLWGVWGLLIGAPLIAIVKAICDHVESLKPVGDLLGR